MIGSEDEEEMESIEERHAQMSARFATLDGMVFPHGEASKHRYARLMRTDEELEDPRLELSRRMLFMSDVPATRAVFRSLREQMLAPESEVRAEIAEMLQDQFQHGPLAVMFVIDFKSARYDYVISLRDQKALELFESALSVALMSDTPGLIFGRGILRDFYTFMLARNFVVLWRHLAQRITDLAHSRKGAQANVGVALKFYEDGLRIAEVLVSDEARKFVQDDIAKQCVERAYYYLCGDVALYTAASLSKTDDPSPIVDKVKEMWQRIGNKNKHAKDAVRQAIDVIRRMSPKCADLFQGIDAAESTNLHRPLPKNASTLRRAKFSEDLHRDSEGTDRADDRFSTTPFANVLSAFDRLKVRENLGVVDVQEYEALAQLISVMEQEMLHGYAKLIGQQVAAGSMTRVQQLAEMFHYLNEDLDIHKKTFQWYLVNVMARIFLRVGNAEEARVWVAVAEQVTIRANRKPGPEFCWFRARVNALCGDFAELTALREERQREQAKAQEKQRGTKAKGAKTAAAIRAQEAEAKKAALAKAEAERAEAERRRREMKVAPEVGELHVGRKEDDDDEKRKVRASDKHAQEKDAAPPKGKEEEQEEEEDEAEEPVVVGPSPTYYLSNTRYKTFCRLASGNWKITRAEICDMMEGLGCRVNIDQGKGSHAVISLPGASAEVLIEGENGELLMVLTEFDMDEQGSDGKKKTAAATGANDKGKKGKGKKKQGGTGEGMMITAPNWDSKWDGHVPIYLRKSIAAALKKMGAVEGKVKKGSPLQQDAQID